MTKPLNGLKVAIIDILTAASEWPIYGFAENDMLRLLKILQTEYNIHFVEPEDEQVNII